MWSFKDCVLRDATAAAAVAAADAYKNNIYFIVMRFSKCHTPLPCLNAVCSMHGNVYLDYAAFCFCKHSVTRFLLLLLLRSLFTHHFIRRLIRLDILQILKSFAVARLLIMTIIILIIITRTHSAHGFTALGFKWTAEQTECIWIKRLYIVILGEIKKEEQKRND